MATSADVALHEQVRRLHQRCERVRQESARICQESARLLGALDAISVRLEQMSDALVDVLSRKALARRNAPTSR